MSSPIKVLEVLPGNRAIVSTAGLYRVERKDTGEIKEELSTAEEADRTIDARSRCCRHKEMHYRKVSYSELSTAGGTAIMAYVVHKYDSNGRYVSTDEEVMLTELEATAMAESFEECHRPGQVRTLVEAVTAVIVARTPPATLPQVEPEGPTGPTRRTPAVT